MNWTPVCGFWVLTAIFFLCPLGVDHTNACVYIYLLFVLAVSFRARFNFTLYYYDDDGATTIDSTLHQLFVLTKPVVQ